jgi:hypothetical protein
MKNSKVFLLKKTKEDCLNWSDVDIGEWVRVIISDYKDSYINELKEKGLLKEINKNGTASK